MTHSAEDKNSGSKKILIVASNPAVSEQTGWPIGFWWAELTHPYWEFTQRGYQVDIASPDGGALQADSWSDPRDRSGYSAEDLLSQKLGGGRCPDACSTARSSSWMLCSSIPVRLSWRSTGIPSPMLAARRNIRRSPPEQGRSPASRALIAATQSTIAKGWPSGRPGLLWRNLPLKSARWSQDCAMSSSAAASRQ
jgi:hypothetical protein